MKELLIFDLDGTLTDTATDINIHINMMLSKFNLPPITKDETKSFTGNGARRLVELSLKGEKLELLEECLMTYNESYNKSDSPNTAVYAGMHDLLRELSKSYKLAIVSNKPQEGTDAVISKFFQDVPFNLVLGQREGLKVKPSREMIDFCLNELNIERQNSLFIGDSDVDFMTSLNAEVDCVCVLWGFRTKQQLQALGGKNFANTASELKLKIAEYNI